MLSQEYLKKTVRYASTLFIFIFVWLFLTDIPSSHATSLLSDKKSGFFNSIGDDPGFPPGTGHTVYHGQVAPDVIFDRNTTYTLTPFIVNGGVQYTGNPRTYPPLPH